MVSNAGHRPLTVAIDARQPADGSVGGVSWVIDGLLRALAELDDGRERYLVIGFDEQRERLESLVGDRMELIVQPQTPLRWVERTLRSRIFRSPRGLRIVELGLDMLPRRPADAQQAPRAPYDSILDRLDCNLVHFPSQRFFESNRPSIYNPHDLQHLHYPKFFTRRVYQRREWLYRRGCHAAQRIAVSSDWVKRDLVSQYGIGPDKIQVIPWGIDQASEQPAQTDLDAVWRRIGFSGKPGPYALYPAATWEHKNHLRLIEALASLRDHDGVRLNLVCCGHRNGFFPTIQRRVRALGLSDQIAFPGVLPKAELNTLYQQALFVVIPSLFEASSALIREAWRWRRPLACAAVTSLPQQAGDTALLFDPTRSEAIAGAMRRLVIDAKLRSDLVANGARRIRRFPWSRTAAAYRALYRSVGGDPLTDDDRALLDRDWMDEP